MADNLTLNAGSGGDTLATDDVGGVQYQRVKVSDGTADSSTHLGVYAEDGVSAGGETGILALGVRRDADTTPVSADGDFHTLIFDANGYLKVEIFDGGGSHTVDGTVAVSAVAGTVTIAGAVTNAGTFATQVDGDALTALQLLDDIVYVDDTATHSTGTSKGALIMAAATPTDGSVGANDIGAVAMSVDRRLHVDAQVVGQDAVIQVTDDGAAILVDGSGVTQPISAASLPLPTGAATAANQSTIIGHVDGIEGLLTTIDGDTGTIAGAVSGTEMQVDIVSIAAGDNNIGNVDIVSLPASTNTLEVVGDVAADAAAAGNPVLVGAQAETMADSAPGTRVSGDLDAVKVAADRDGAIYTHPHGPQVWSYHLNTSTAQTDTAVHATPGTGLSLYVTDIVFSSGSATAINIFFEEGSTTVLGPYYLEAVAGRGVSIHFQTPKKITADTALTYTTSASIAQCIDVTGFTAP